MGDVFGKIRNAFVGTATPYYVTSGHFYLESNNIKNGQINRDSEIFINEYFYQKQKDKWLKSGDMVMVQSGHVGHTAIIPDELHNSIAHALIMFTDYLDKSVPYFFNFFFQTNKAKREIDKITTGNTVKHILASDMKDFPIFLPSYEEQTQIGNFFKQLDDTIALHQRELEKFKILKTSYLENIFLGKVLLFTAKNTITWEQRKFLDNIESIIDFRGRTPRKLGMEWGESGYLALSALNVKNGCIDPSVDAHFGDEALYQKWMTGNELKQGQVLFTTEAPMGNVAQIPDDKKYILSQRTIAFNIKEKYITDDFLAVLLRSPNVFNDLDSLSSGGTAKGISQKSLSNLYVKVPNSLEEQTQIGNFFKQLDDTIALHQREVEKYKKIKQSYLENMFI